MFRDVNRVWWETRSWYEMATGDIFFINSLWSIMCEQFHYYTTQCNTRHYHFYSFFNVKWLVEQSKYIISNKIYILKLIYVIDKRGMGFRLEIQIRKSIILRKTNHKKIGQRELFEYEAKMDIGKWQRPVVCIIEGLTSEIRGFLFVRSLFTQRVCLAQFK